MKPSSDGTAAFGEGDRNTAAFKSDIIVPKRLELIGEGEECEEEEEEFKDQTPEAIVIHERTESSDSFTSLSTDIQNVITNTLKLAHKSDDRNMGAAGTDHDEIEDPVEYDRSLTAISAGFNSRKRLGDISSSFAPLRQEDHLSTIALNGFGSSVLLPERISPPIS